jgi:Helix-turn-helix domain
MSWQAIGRIWPLRLPATVKSVAVRLAWSADEGGGSIFPSIGTVAEETGLCRRAVQGAIRQLEAEGILMKVKDPVPGSRRPTEYRLMLDHVAGIEDGAKDQEGRTTCTGAANAPAQDMRPTGAPDAPLPAHDMHPRGAPHAPNTVIEKSEEKSGIQSDSLPAKPKRSKLVAAEPDTSEADFASFWAEYPRKADKGGARKAFKAALKKSSAGEIVRGAQRYAEQEAAKRTEARYIAHPTTWLNGERWSDEPEPEPPASTFDPFGVQRSRNDRQRDGITGALKGLF